MRTLLLLSALAVVAAAASLVGSSAATNTPLTCTSQCVIATSSAGYMPPLFDLAAGVPLVWHSTDIAHFQVEGASAVTTPGGGCLGVRSSGGQNSLPLTFQITGGVLTSDVDGGTACTSAVALPDGSFVVPYYCEIHPFTMRAALTVR